MQWVGDEILPTKKLRDYNEGMSLKDLYKRTLLTFSPAKQTPRHLKVGGKSGDSNWLLVLRRLSNSIPWDIRVENAEGKGPKVEKGVVEDKPSAAALVGEMTTLMNFLRSLKAIQIMYIESGGVVDSDGREGGVALLDGGATHALRQGRKDELEDAEPVQVELAHGSTVLYRKTGCSTLLASDPVEPIIPVRLLVENGYKMTWSAPECSIFHPAKGQIRCWKGGGCPVMDRKEALLLLADLEKRERHEGSIFYRYERLIRALLLTTIGTHEAEQYKLCYKHSKWGLTCFTYVDRLNYSVL